MLNARVSFILLFFQCLRVAGFASWFATDSQYCSRVMKDGEIIMNNPAANSNDRSIQVFRNSEPIENGATYMPGDKLDILLSEVEGQFVIETTRGTFEDGGCDGKRSIQSPVVLVLPDDGGEDINIWAGWAYGHSQVLISPTFTLKGTPGTVRAEITKEAHPEAKKQGMMLLYAHLHPLYMLIM